MTTAVAVDPGDSRIWLLWKQEQYGRHRAKARCQRSQHCEPHPAYPRGTEGKHERNQETIEHQRAARARLRNPPNGRDSSELEVVSAYTFRRIVSEASILRER